MTFVNIQKYFLCPLCNKRSVWGVLDKKCATQSGLSRFLGSPLSYKDKFVKDALHSFKYGRAKNMAEPLAKILLDFLNKNDFRSLIDDTALVVPTPLYNFRERDRGFNQSTEIAKFIAKHYNLDMEQHLLIKTKNTRNQADIENKPDRADNIKGAFACLPGKRQIFKNKKVILIDDVYTTGSTMRECAKVLKKSGARQIWGITLAK